MKKYRIGYTTGVFDMFHVGHLNILRRAKDECRYLIVGVSTDELVKEYKQKIPIIPYKNRCEIIRSIKYVDEVVPQISMDKKRAWDELRFDVLFHGSDWEDSEMYNDIINELSAIGVDVIFFPHTPGVSSTILSERIKDQKG